MGDGVCVVGRASGGWHCEEAMDVPSTSSPKICRQ